MHQKSKTIPNPHLVLALGVTGVSFSAFLARLTAAPPAAIAFWRLVITCLLLSPLIIRDRASFKGLAKKDILISLLGGVLLALHFLFWYTSLRATSVSNATLLVNIHPLLLIAFSWFGKERVRPRSLPWAGVALIGIALLSSSDFQTKGVLAGNLYAAAGAMMLGGYYYTGQAVRSRVSLGVYATLVYGASALLLFVGNVAASVPLTGYGAGDWLAFFALAAAPTICGHTLINWSLKYLPAVVVSISALGEPVLATLLAIPLLGEIPGPKQLGAGALVIGGIGLFLLTNRKQR